MVAAAMIGGAVIGGLASSSAADKQASAATAAAATSAASADKATALQQQMFQAQQQAQAPYQAIGSQSINALAGLMGVGQPMAYGTPAVTASQQAAAPQYYGMSRDQIRNALLPQYTTTTQPQAQQTWQQIYLTGPKPTNTQQSIQFAQNARAKAAAQSAAPQTTVNDAALNAQIDQILQQHQTYAQQIAAQQNAPQQGAMQGAASPLGDFGSLAKPFSMADYQADPGYAFRLSEGMRGLEQSAAARGGLLSGNTLKGAQQYGQGLASQEYQNAYNRYQSDQANKFNRLASLAGIGQTAANTLGQAGQNYATSAGNIAMGSAANQGNALMAAGQARASSMQGFGNAIGNAMNAYAMNNMNNSSMAAYPSYTSNISGGVNTSLQGFYTPAA